MTDVLCTDMAIHAPHPTLELSVEPRVDFGQSIVLRDPESWSHHNGDWLDDTIQQ